MGAINCLTKELFEDTTLALYQVKKCQLDDGFSYKKIKQKTSEDRITITEYFYKNNICFFVNRISGYEEWEFEFQRLYYDRKGDLIQVLSTQPKESSYWPQHNFFYTELIEKEKINYIIDEISSSEMKLDRIFWDK